MHEKKKKQPEKLKTDEKRKATVMSLKDAKGHLGHLYYKMCEICNKKKSVLLF